MDSSTIVQRTPAGDAELAAPAHGLSLTQRRFLTLLDTCCSTDALALRHPADPDKFARDLGRLVQLGLVACDTPARANRDEPSAIAVRRRSAALPPRLRYALVVPAIAALAWGGWHALRPPAAPNASTTGTRLPGASAGVPDAPAAEPQPIAVRVLRGEPVERSREAAKEPRAGSVTARNAEPKVAEPQLAKAVEPLLTKPHPALRVERRSPPPEDPAGAPNAGASGGSLVSAPKPIGDPASPPRTAVTDAPPPANVATTPAPPVKRD